MTRGSKRRDVRVLFKTGEHWAIANEKKKENDRYISLECAYSKSYIKICNHNPLVWGGKTLKNTFFQRFYFFYYKTYR